MPHDVVNFGHDSGESSFGAEAIHALTKTGSIAAQQIQKTLIVAVPNGFAVAILPASARLSLKAFAGALGAAKASLADRNSAERVTGYVVGAVSPFGQRKTPPTVVDAGALTWERVYCSAGRRGWDFAVSPQDLIRLTGAITATSGRRARFEQRPKRPNPQSWSARTVECGGGQSAALP